MPIDFKLPDMGENIDSADVIGVLVAEGDTIAAEQGVVEVETGKAAAEVACPHAGRVVKIHVKKGDKITSGTTLVTIEPAAVEKPSPPQEPAAPAKVATQLTKATEEPVRPSAARETPAAAPAQPAKAPAPARRAASAPPVVATEAAPEPAAVAVATRHAAPSGFPIAAAPATRRLARELGIDLTQVRGTGPGGRITREDVTAAVRELATRPVPPPQTSSRRAGTAAPPEGEVEQDRWGTVRRVPMSAIRRTIAANMARSHAAVPHVTNFDDADITDLERLRKGGMAELGQEIKLTSMAFLTKAVALALRLHPAINASSQDLEQGQVLYKDYVSIGIAVDTPRGLVVPVLRNADRTSIPQIARELAAVAERARAGQLSIDDMRGGTFTISNLGAIGGTYSTPIINYPEVAVLLVGRARQLPVVVGERIEPRLLCPLSLSYDHRWVDGAVAARFLNEVKGYLEAPARLLLAP